MMLKGDRIWLRPAFAADLAQRYAAHENNANRGPYYPWRVMSAAS